MRARRLVTGLAVLLILGGAVSAAAALVPFETFRPLGATLRRAEDLTVERFMRLDHVFVMFALGSWATGALLVARASLIARWFSAASHDLRVAMKSVPGVLHGWGAFTWGVIAVGVALRGLHLGDSMAYDESYTFNNLARQPFPIGIADYNSTNNHLLNTLLVHLSWRVFGASEWAIRLPVFVIGCAMLPLSWVWASRWLGRPVGLVTLALVAVSPLLITYSTDARGYIMATTAAVALDDAVARLFDGRSSKPLAWIQATLSASLGLCAMPIMLYAIAAVGLWAAARVTFPAFAGHTPADSMAPMPDITPRSINPVAVTLSVLVSLMIVGAMYAPAYVFRGLRASQDHILDPVPLALQPLEQWKSLRGAWEWWTTGFPPGWAWFVAVVIAAVRFRFTAADRVRWLAWPVAMTALHLVGRVAPPPRVYIIVFPWIALVAAAGFVAMVPPRRSLPAIATGICALVIITGGVVYALTHPVLIYPEERASFVSVREAMLDLQERTRRETSATHRLIAPLPTDLPAIFYRDREHIAVEINGTPASGETLWLLARHGEQPETVLRSPLINLPEVAARTGFEKVASFRTLDLYRATTGP